jgi:hypothetical protein
MHDVSAPAWRQTLDRHHTALVDDLTAQFAAEIESSVTAERERAENEAARERERANNEAARADFAESQRTAAEAALERERTDNQAARERERAKNEASAEERKNADETSRRKLAESLNQTLRRIRQTTAEHETLQLLLEDTAGSADRAVVLLIENSQARVAASRGAVLSQTEPEHHDEEPGDEKDSGGDISLADAPALASCVESRDPVIAMMAPAEISPLLAVALSGAGAGKAYLFPVTIRQNTVALMIACGNVAPAPIELLCEAAGMKLETFETDTAPAPAKEPLVQIASPQSPAPRTESTPTTWSKLTPEQQALHLRAQRTARVRVAQIRIGESDALRAGAQTGNIYNAVRQLIDAARQEFQQVFMSQSPTMVDYLHLEIIRSLAHDDSRLLGQNYPGPLA